MRLVAGSDRLRRSPLHPDTDTRHRLFENARRIVHTHVLAIDALVAATVAGLSTGWLAHAGRLDWEKAVLQVAIVAPLVWRRTHPTAVFCVVSALALGQWGLGYKLIGDVSLLIALYTVAVHESRLRALLASAVMEIGAVLAATRWRPAGTVPRSFLFLTATVVAALSPVSRFGPAANTWVGWQSAQSASRSSAISRQHLEPSRSAPASPARCTTSWPIAFPSWSPWPTPPPSSAGRIQDEQPKPWNRCQPLVDKRSPICDRSSECFGPTSPTPRSPLHLQLTASQISSTGCEPPV